MSNKLLENLGLKIREVEYSNSGVYFLCDEESILYIGKSKRLSSRIDSHNEAKIIPFSQAYFISCNSSEMDDLEIKYIRKFKPSFNKQLYEDEHDFERNENLVSSNIRGIICIKCGSENIRCTDSRPSNNNTIRRRRKCSECKYRFTTLELSIDKINLLSNKKELCLV